MNSPLKFGCALLLGLCICLLPVPGAESAPQLITNLAVARALTTEQVATNPPPFQIEGTVLYAEDAIQSWFVHDGQGGMYFFSEPGPPKVVTGQRVRLTGIVSPSGFAPALLVARVVPLGTGEWPAPYSPPVERLLDGQFDSQWIELSGVVKMAGRVGDRNQVVLAGAYGSVTANFSAKMTDALPANWLGAKVRIRGVCGTVFNERNQLRGIQLFVPRLQDVTIVEPAVADPFALPPRPLNELLTFDPRADPYHRVHVRGIVTHRRADKKSDGRFYLQADTHGVAVTPIAPADLHLGDLVSAVGYVRAGENSPELEYALVRVLSTGPAVAPVEITTAEIDRLTDPVVVTVEGILNDTLQGKVSDIAELMLTNGTPFQVVLEHPPRGAHPLLDLHPGYMVRFTGVFSTISQNEFSPSTASFRLLLREASDIKVLTHGPYWNLARAKTAAELLAVFALGLAGLTAILKRRVSKQNALLREEYEKKHALERRYHDLLENAADLIFSVDLAGRVLTANAAALRIMGLSGLAIDNFNLIEFIAPHDRELILQRLARARELGRVTDPTIVVDVLTRAGQSLSLEAAIRFVHRPGEAAELEVVARDITDRRRAERERDSQQSVLELIARGNPLEAVLDGVVRHLEAQCPGMMCSILRLDDDEVTLRHATAPSLPEAYVKAVDGIRAGEGVGSCGTAVARRANVIVSDITTDPLWVNFRELAQRHQLAACWSFPVFSKGRQPLGTLACYYARPRSPQPGELRLIEAASSLVSVALERHRADLALLAEEARHRLVVSTLVEGVMLVQADGSFSTFNDSAVRILGLTREEIAARRFNDGRWQTIHEDGSAFAIEDYPLSQAFRTGRAVSAAAMGVILPDQSVVWLSVHAVPAELRPDGTVKSVVVSFTDITARKQAQDELLRAKDAAEAASRAKTDFLAMISHELRTPLNGVIGFTYLLLDGSLPPEQNRFVETIKQSAEALLTIINDLLDFSKIEAGRMELTREIYHPADIVAAVAELLSARAEERGLELAIAIAPEVPSSLLGDPSRVRQVLMNLVGNAIKFTDEGHVLIEAGVRDGHLRIAISDTGPGIPAEKHALLFQRFSQVESSTTRRHGGTGLGLAISKQLVELMGGRIGLENSPEQGSTFWFTLPLGANVSGTTPPTPSLGALHVLGVNLAEVNQRALARQLTAWGCHFRATPAERAITELASAAAAGRAWDLVIADLAEPSAALARLVRTIRTGGSWPVPAILGLHRRSTPAGFFQDACDSTLVKPIAVASSLLSSVQAALAARHRAPEAVRLASLTAPAEPQVLLAQDDGASTMFTTRLLERAGCQVVNARNGSDALALARRQPFQLLLVDCHLPDPDGLAVARALRLDPGASGSVRIIGLKSDLSDADRESCRAAGMDDCHEKPLRGEGLKNLLDRWLPATARPDSQT